MQYTNEKTRKGNHPTPWQSVQDMLENGHNEADDRLFSALRHLNEARKDFWEWIQSTGAPVFSKEFDGIDMNFCENVRFDITGCMTSATEIYSKYIQYLMCCTELNSED